MRDDVMYGRRFEVGTAEEEQMLEGAVEMLAGVSGTALSLIFHMYTKLVW